MPYTLSAITFYWKYIRYNFNKLQVYSIFVFYGSWISSTNRGNLFLKRDLQILRYKLHTVDPISSN